MPGITVAVDGKRLATIDLADLQMMDVSVFGGLTHEEHAMLNASGVGQREGGSGGLTWIDLQALQPGEVVTIAFNEGCDGADRGRTLAELYPDEPVCTKTDFAITADMAEELRSQPRHHERFRVQAQTSTGKRVRATSDAANTDFSFGLLWNCYRPHEARVSLRTHCLDDVIARSGGTRHLDATLLVGESASFSLLLDPGLTLIRRIE